MIRPLVAATFLILLSGTAYGQGGDARALDHAAGDFDEAYLDALRSSRVDADVTYFDPEAPAPPFVIDEEPVPVAEIAADPVPGSAGDLDLTLVLALAILAGIAFAAFRLSGGRALSFKTAEDDERVTRRAATPAKRTAEDTPPKALAEIAAMPDRRLALIALAQAALGRVIAAHGMTMRESWTARDALRRVPSAQRLLPDLRALVIAAERAQFGDAVVGETEFARHLDVAGRLLTDAVT